MELKRKIIVILGPTASGKSEFGIKLAKKINGEIISADSRQVYEGLNIGSGKVNGKWKNESPINIATNLKNKISNLKSKVFIYKNIIHHCIDVVSPKKIFTVVDFKKCAEKAIEKIFAKNKVPIIVGGTGLYIQAIVDGIVFPEVKPNWKLRKKLEKKTTEEMFAALKKLDPKRAKTIDSKNPRRLIRAIEIASFLGKVPKISKISNLKSKIFLQIGIKLPDKILKNNIEKRIKNMIKGGLVKETKKMRKYGLSWKRIYELGFEYKYPALFLRNKISKKDMFVKMVLENWRYAKRQMTWFSAHGGSASGGKRDKRIKWINNPKDFLLELKNINQFI